MSPAELATACMDAIEQAMKRGEPSSKAQVMLTMPRGWRAPPGFPRGELACITSAGESVRYLPALRVAHWLVVLSEEASAP